MDDAAPATPVLPDEFVTTGSEREVLAGFLELYRGIPPRKLAGLSEDDARRPLVPSRTTLLGLVKHLASVEREWFGQILGPARVCVAALDLRAHGRGDQPARWHADILREQTDGSTGVD